MMEDIKGYEVARLQDPTPMQLVETIDSAERANIDIQVSTAHAYPRNLSRTINNSIAIATMDRETAQTCGYALPRGGKPITGPSVHLAKIIAQQYGNMRVEARVVNVTGSQVISRGTAWDLENNYAVAFEVRRSILTSKGARFSEDMITVTGNAANAIAYRNAVFAVVPKSITDKVYKAAQECITGDLSDETKLIKRRDAAIKYFNDQYGITEEEVIKLCGKQTVNQIGAEEIALLLGIQQSLKDGDTTVDEVMAPIRNSKEAKSSKLTEMANRAAKGAKKSQTADQPTEASAETIDKETGEVKPAENGGMQTPNPQI
jgi:hypothetical protein|nr:MAG TPA: hypothetical protein [Caudoviricetes sp.]